MHSIYPLIETIVRLTSLTLTYSSWEMCVLNLIHNHNQSPVYFVCKSPHLCPSNNVYKMLRTTSQTYLGIETQNLPNFKASDLVFLLVHDETPGWNAATIEKYWVHGRNDFKIVLIVDSSDNRVNDFDRMRMLFTAMWQSGVVSSAVLLKNLTSAEIFTYIPFKRGCQDTTPMSLGQCIRVAASVFDLTYKVTNLNQCRIRLSVLDDRPVLWNPLSGPFAKMVEEVAVRMNFQLETVVPLENVRGNICGPEEFIGYKKDVVTGRSHMAVGLTTISECGTLEYIGYPLSYCMGWCTPVMSGDDYIYLFLLRLFRPNVWMALVITMGAIVLVVLMSSTITQEHSSRHDAVNVALLVYTTVPLNFHSPSVRFILAIWLLGCVVIRAGYEGELKSFSAAPLGSYIIKTLDELASKNISLCGTSAVIDMLRDIEEHSVQAVARKSEYCKGSLYDGVESAAKNRDQAVFTVDFRCNLVSKELTRGNTMLLYDRTGSCFQTYGQIYLFVVMPGSPFKTRLKDLMLRFAEGGLINKWLGLGGSEIASGEVKPFNLNHFFPALFVLCLGWSSGIAIFIIENSLKRCSSLKRETCFPARSTPLTKLRQVREMICQYTQRPVTRKEVQKEPTEEG